MISSAQNYPVSTLFGVDSKILYRIPRYQRQYTWAKKHWERLLDDLLENKEGYFLGSIICINQSDDAVGPQPLELVDGQQRMTTITLLIAAIYRCLHERRADLDEDQLLDMSNLKRKLVLRDPEGMVRLTPQVENRNLDDYLYVLYQCGLIPNAQSPPFAGNRRVMKAFRYFEYRISEFIESREGAVGPVFSFLVPRLNQACIVKIEVDNHADAYTLFESLNNRGEPLTAVDLIKNSLLAKLELKHPGKIDEHYTKWTLLISDLGDDYRDQERFFRNYYNAFRWSWGSKELANRSNMMRLFQERINKDPDAFLTDIRKAGGFNMRLLDPTRCDEEKSFDRALIDLQRIQGVPSHVLLLLLLTNQEEIKLQDAQIEKIIRTLNAFFVRRNLTDKPPTRDLIRLFTNFAAEARKLPAEEIPPLLADRLSAISASDEKFREALAGPIYEENVGVTRFVLCALAEEAMTSETYVDLWRRKDKGIFVWTIEHIFPQGANIPEPWVTMIADGDKKLAEKIQAEHVHELGNLTITGFNSTLGNKSFEDKRDRKNQKGRAIGYQNGLDLNRELAKADAWSVDAIKDRTTELVEGAIKLFPLS